VTNTIAAGALQTNFGNNAAAASANLTVTANAPTVAKAFAPASIAVGGTSVLTITLTNNNATAATLSANLVDTLPAGVTLVNATFGGTCSGTKSGAAGGNTVTYASGATIPGGAPGSCTITANVTSSTAGTVTNTIAAGALQTNNGSNAAAGSANLTVTANAPTVAKAFAPATILSGGTSVLTITLSNNNAAAATLSANLVDNLPAGVTLANAIFGGTCSGTKSGTAGGTSVTYAHDYGQRDEQHAGDGHQHHRCRSTANQRWEQRRCSYCQSDSKCPAGADGDEERDASGAGGGCQWPELHDHDRCGEWTDDGGDQCQ